MFLRGEPTVYCTLGSATGPALRLPRWRIVVALLKNPKDWQCWDLDKWLKLCWEETFRERGEGGGDGSTVTVEPKVGLGINFSRH